MSQLEHAIDLTEVSKTYKGRVEALRSVAMQVPEGQIFGLIGPNGAGKSTLVKILMTIVRPSRCRGSLLGARIGSKSVLRRVGYLPEHHQFASYLKGWQVLDFYGALAGVPRRDRRRRGAELLELVRMTPWGNKRVGGYSKGMRQRLGLANALINDPDLVILDEPTDGIDPQGRIEIRDILREINARGTTIMLNSHLLSELETVCGSVAILVKGRVVRNGTIEELTAGTHKYRLQVSAGYRRMSDLMRRVLGESCQLDEEAKSGTGTLAGAPLTFGECNVEIETKDAGVIQPIIDGLRETGATLESVRLHRPTLEDLFMDAVADPETGESAHLGAVQGKPRWHK